MKPDWKDAPEWAQYLARHGDGEWFWWETEPTFERMDGQWGEGGKCQFSGCWETNDTLEKRP